MIMDKILLFSSSICLILACSPQITETVKIPESQPIPTQVYPSENAKDADNPCTTLEDLEASLQDEVWEAYSLYKDEMRAKNYEGALKLWKKAFDNAPAANGRVTYQFDDGVRIYKYLFEQTEDKDQKREYVDAIFGIYDKRLECYPNDKYTVLGQKAFNSYYDLRGYASDDDIFNWFASAFDGKGMDADYFIINPF